MLTSGRLGSRQHLHKPISTKAHPTAKVVRPCQMPVQNAGVSKCCQHDTSGWNMVPSRDVPLPAAVLSKSAQWEAQQLVLSEACNAVEAPAGAHLFRDVELNWVRM